MDTGHLLISLAAEHDLVIIGGGVAGYVAAIKAGQEGMKVRHTPTSTSNDHTKHPPNLSSAFRWHASKNAAP